MCTTISSCIVYALLAIVCWFIILSSLYLLSFFYYLNKNNNLELIFVRSLYILMMYDYKMIYATTGQTRFAPYTHHLGKFKHENMLYLDDSGSLMLWTWRFYIVANSYFVQGTCKFQNVISWSNCTKLHNCTIIVCGIFWAKCIGICSSADSDFVFPWRSRIIIIIFIIQ